MKYQALYDVTNDNNDNNNNKVKLISVKPIQDKSLFVALKI